MLLPTISPTERRQYARKLRFLPPRAVPRTGQQSRSTPFSSWGLRRLAVDLLPLSPGDPRSELVRGHFAESVTHFVTKLVRAAPASFLSSAVRSQVAWTSGAESLMHFFVKLTFAAPASFLSAA